LPFVNVLHTNDIQIDRETDRQTYATEYITTPLHRGWYRHICVFHVIRVEGHAEAGAEAAQNTIERPLLTNTP